MEDGIFTTPRAKVRILMHKAYMFLQVWDECIVPRAKVSAYPSFKVVLPHGIRSNMFEKWVQDGPSMQAYYALVLGVITLYSEFLPQIPWRSADVGLLSSCFLNGSPQSLCIAPLINPTTMGTPKLLSVPTAAWETKDTPVNEGPAAFYRNGKTYLAFSASFCWTSSYALGYLTVCIWAYARLWCLNTTCHKFCS